MARRSCGPFEILLLGLTEFYATCVEFDITI